MAAETSTPTFSRRRAHSSATWCAEGLLGWWRLERGSNRAGASGRERLVSRVVSSMVVNGEVMSCGREGMG